MFNSMPLQVKVQLKRFILLIIRLIFHYRKSISSTSSCSIRDISSVLLVETALMGDVVAITPLIYAVRKRLPDVRLDVLIEKKYTPLLRFERRIDTLYSIDTAQRRALLSTIVAMRKAKYTLVVCTSPGVRNSIITLLVGKYLVSGYLIHQSKDTSFFNNFYSVMIGGKRTGFYPKRAHLTARALNSLTPLYPDICSADAESKLHLAPIVEQERNTSLQLSGFIRPQKVNIVIHPCASWSYKQWPSENMVCLIRKLFRLYADKVHITLLGLPSEKALLEAIKQGASQKIMLLTGADLLTVMTLIKGADIFLGNDSGPKHVADAFSRPLVELLGPSLPETVGGKNNHAYSLYANVPCSPCSHLRCKNNRLCMNSIKVESVLSRLCSIIDRHIKLSSSMPSSKLS